MIIPVRLSGEYQVQVLNADRTPRYVSHWMPNIITDAGLNRIGQGHKFLKNCYVGTGTVTPQATDSALEQEVAGTGDRRDASSGRLLDAPYGGRYQASWEFGLGDVVGNMSEVGVGWSSGGLLSRALFVNNNGEASTITVKDNEILYVTYRLFNYAPQTDEMFTFDTPAGTRTAVVRPARLGNGDDDEGWGIRNRFLGSLHAFAYDGALGDTFSDPSGQESLDSGGSGKGYENDSFQKDAEFYWGLTRANFATGVSAIMYQSRGLGCYQFSIDPPFMKTDQDILSITVRTLWSRYEE